MSINKTYAVFGLGRYGIAVAKKLAGSGAQVLAVDINEEVVDSLANEVPYCKCADVTVPETFELLGIRNVDVAVIAMANSLEASVMAIALCKEAGVETVIAKCGSEMHGKIFTRVGADRVIFPESESGTRLAKNLLNSGFTDMVDLSEEVSMVESGIPDNWIDKNLIELNLRKKYGINVVAIRKGDQVSVNINPEEPLTKDMKLIVIAQTKILAKLSR